MKMEFTLKTARDGEIGAIHAATSDQVEEGIVIATIEGDDA